MPSRDETALGPLCVMATTTRTSQSSGSSNGSAIESLPSGRSPRCHSTNPPKIERAADPDPRRARADSAGDSSRSPAARVDATASAANAAADEARPAPRGTQLRVTTRARDPMQPASARTRSRKRTRRSRSEPLAGSPSMVTSSPGPVAAPPNPTCASTDRPESVSEMLPVAGRFRTGSRFPQYLTRATLTLLRAVTAGTGMRGAPLLPLSPTGRIPARTASFGSTPIRSPDVRRTQGCEQAGFSLVEALRVEGVLEVQVGVVEVVAELMQEGAQEGAICHHLPALRRPHPEGDAIGPGTVRRHVEPMQLAALVVRPLSLDPNAQRRHPERPAHAVGNALCQRFHRCRLLAT